MKIAHPRHDSDCTAAAIATLLELPIEEVPSFWREGKTPGAAQYEAVRKWLAARGYHYYYSECAPRQLKTFAAEKRERGCSWPPAGYWLGQIARVESLRDGDAYHVVVMKGQRCVFNPSGSVKQTLEADVWLLGYYLLVPLDPAK